MKTKYIIIIVGLILIIALLLFEQIRIENKITEIEKELGEYKVLNDKTICDNIADLFKKTTQLATASQLIIDIAKEIDKRVTTLEEREQDTINLFEKLGKTSFGMDEILQKHIDAQINNLQEEIEEVKNSLQDQINIIAKYLKIKS